MGTTGIDTTANPNPVDETAHSAALSRRAASLFAPPAGTPDRLHPDEAHYRALTALAAFGWQALVVDDMQGMLQNAVDAIVQGLATPYCAVQRLDGKDGKDGPVVLEAAAGMGDNWFQRPLAGAFPGSQIAYVLDQSEPLVIGDLVAEVRFIPSEILAAQRLRSGVEAVIRGGGRTYGILGGYAREPHAFTAQGAQFLQTIANVLGAALARKHTLDELAYLSRYDALTDLPNRSLFRDQLTLRIAEARRDGCMVGVLYIDMDGFKHVNDAHGHDAGDRLLTLVGERLRACTPGTDTVARQGGDEFVVLIANLQDADHAELVAEHLGEALAQPFDLDGREIWITVSIGIAIYPDDGLDADLLIKNADTAMYQGKEQGRNNFQSYSVQLDDAAIERRELGVELRHALEHHEFELHYQPQVNLETGKVIGAEAFLRWLHPRRGVLAAGEFIGVAEETGLIVPMGLWVLETACRQTVAWQRAGFPELFVAVNVSPVEIRRGKVVAQVRRALELSGLAPRYLEIDVDEAGSGVDAVIFTETIAELHGLGVSIAIDDFGTGQAGLKSLRYLPIDKVKINQELTRDIATQSDDATIVQAVITMAHRLRVAVIAKGVESGEQARELQRLGCDIAQGYLYGAPLQARYFTELNETGIPPQAEEF